MAVRKIGNYYYAAFRDEYGRQHTLATRCTTHAEAVKWEISNKKMVDARKSSINLIKANPNYFTVFQNAEKIENRACGRKGLRLDKMIKIAQERRKTLSQLHCSKWKHFVENCGFTYAKEITPKVALNYLDQFFGEKSPKTWNNTKSILNTVFRLCLVQAEMGTSPFEPITNKQVLKEDVETHRNLTEHEIRRVMNSDAPEHLKIMTMLSRWTAQRLETCAKMCYNNFDFEKKVFLAQPGKTSRFDKWVCVPLFPELEKYLLSISGQIKDKNAPIVESFGYVNDKAMSQQFVRLLARLKIESDETGKASFHSLRGTAITWMKDHGIDEEIRRDITGHSTKRIEDIYARSINRVSDMAKSFTERQ